ncbi:uncharacterized protein DUF1109 [Burkholderia sp. 28_3]|jgi:hypothetical protein|nr:uncharacterized protein DUF1109 [Burkholderia sp. 28_3]QFR15862.1 RNA polymerase sigma factor [Burkholderia contaminans]GLZ75042.1 hypothetical protein Bcon01_80870 [Burkholderia contaminans]
MEEAADSRVLRDAPSRLPQGQRDAIRTLKLEEMSLKEAAVASGMTVAALEVAVHRGVTLVLTGVPLSLTLLIMLRHAARLAPVPVVMAGSVAVSAMTAVALSLYHPLDATMMILAWNVGLIIVLLIASASYGARLFRWVGAGE